MAVPYVLSTLPESPPKEHLHHQAAVSSSAVGELCAKWGQPTMLTG